MNEQDIQLFVGLVKNYFQTTTGTAAQIGAPYLSHSRELELLDYSAAIGISGNQKGVIYFTATRALARKLVRQSGEAQAQEELCADMVGEVANTLSGNARAQMGSGFMISVPLVITGRPDNLSVPPRLPVVVLPVKWSDERAFVIVCLALN